MDSAPPSADVPTGPRLTDEEILAGIRRRREEILTAWDDVEAAASAIAAAAGIAASDFSFSCDGGNHTQYGHESFGYVADDVAGELSWGDDEDHAPDEAWETLGVALDDLALLTAPTVGPVHRADVDYCDHDLALLLYCSEDDEGYLDEEGSPLFQRYLAIGEQG